MRAPRPAAALAGLAIVYVLLAATRGLDHDESQYVAAARLTAAGLWPYRDFAYLQTPLQPLLFAPVAWAAGDAALVALRLVNALLAVAAVAFAWGAMRRGGASAGVATACAGLFATCDILLFAAGTARNDALPAALLAAALVPLAGRTTRAGALAAGLLLSAAAAAKLSYALPAAACGVYALARPARVPPLPLALGAVPAAVLVAALAVAAPEGFWFGTLAFPAHAPAEYYAATGRAWRLAWWAKGVDAIKFLALGPALLALVVVRWRGTGAVGIVLAAGLVAGVLPLPVWRQYLLPALPPLFVLLALRWQARPPGRALARAFAGFAAIGLIPSVVAIGGSGLGAALRETRALAGTGLAGRTATLAPQLLPAAMTPDARFAAGPFHFRSTGLLDGAAEARLRLVSRARLATLDADPPALLVVGGEGAWTAGDARLDAVLERWALARGWTRVPLASARLRLYARPSAAMRLR